MKLGDAKVLADGTNESNTFLLSTIDGVNASRTDMFKQN